jgi:enoyl-CoA hydratase
MAVGRQNEETVRERLPDASQSMTGSTVTLGREGPVGLVTLDRPHASNALDLDMLSELETAIAGFESESTIRTLVITGAGRSFSAGGDIKVMRDLDLVQGRQFVERGHQVMNHIAGSRLVSIAALNGYALGGGAELAVACDVRIASDQAQVGFPEVSIGLYPGWGGTQRAARLVGPGRAKMLMLSSETLSAAEAVRIGLVDRVVPSADLFETALTLAKRISANSPTAVRLTKMAISVGLDLPLSAALRLEIEGWMVNLATRDRVEGLSAYLEKRKPEWHDA